MTRNLVADKEGELGSVAPVVQQHQKEIDALTNKLNSLNACGSTCRTSRSPRHTGRLFPPATQAAAL